MPGSDNRRFAERRNRTRIHCQGDIHRMLRMIDGRSDQLDLGQRPALAAEIVDDPRLRRAQVAGCGRVVGLEANDPGRQLVLREFHAGGIDNAHRAELEQRARIDIDRDGRDRAVAIAFGGAREGFDVARGDRQRRPIDRDRSGRIIVSRTPQSVDHRPEIARRAPRERFAVRRGVLPQLVKGRSFHHRVLERLVAACHIDRDLVGNGRSGEWRRRFVRTPEPEEVESPSAALDTITLAMSAMTRRMFRQASENLAQQRVRLLPYLPQAGFSRLVIPAPDYIAHRSPIQERSIEPKRADPVRRVTSAPRRLRHAVARDQRALAAVDYVRGNPHAAFDEAGPGNVARPR